jgi:uncharacterized membrane protein
VLESLLPGAQHLQNIHPLVVHFPLAFLAGASVLYGLGWITEIDSLATTGLWLLLLGTVGAAAAVATGLHAQDGVMVDPAVRDALLEPHEQLMLTTLGLSVVLTVWGFLGRPLPARGRTVFLLLFLVLLAVMSRGADFGGRMVFDYNAGGSACPQPIGFTK